jgi:DNA invertase Pin-like site-specific DNA recombinase
MSEQYLEMAYARVSSKQQSLDRQEESIKQIIPDLSLRYFFKDKSTGKEFNREQYTAMKDKIVELQEINPDIKIRVTLHEFDRLCRNLEELLKEISWFEYHGVVLRFLDIPSEFAEATGLEEKLFYKIWIMIKCYQAEKELVDKKKRTEEGIKAAHARGVIFGRKEIIIDEKKFRDIATRANAREISHADAMRILNMTPYLYWKHFNKLFPNYVGKHSLKGGTEQ